MDAMYVVQLCSVWLKKAMSKEPMYVLNFVSFVVSSRGGMTSVAGGGMVTRGIVLVSTIGGEEVSLWWVPTYEVRRSD